MPIRHLPTALLLAGAMTLVGCQTQTVRPVPSKAIAQALAAAKTQTGPTCAANNLADISPLGVDFPYDAAEMSTVGQRRLAAAAAWLKCNPGVEATIIPSADNHGDAAHQNQLATQRAQATVETLRALGATAVILHITPRDGADPLTTTHLLIKANGRGW
jgi:outer membrane protein OmpA-like peptidoglycan-associated protein